MKLFAPIYRVFVPSLAKFVVASGDGNTAPNQPEYKRGAGGGSMTPYNYNQGQPGVDDGGDCNAVDGNDIEYFTIVDSAVMDQFVQLSKPRRKITLLSAPAPQGQSKIFLHFFKTGHGISPAPITGLEPWIQFTGANSADPPPTIKGAVIQFRQPVSKFFISVYSVGGASVGGFLFAAGEDLVHAGFINYGGV